MDRHMHIHILMLRDLLASLKSAGQANRLETPARVDTAVSSEFLLVKQGFPLKAFNCLGEAHPHHQE